jgi:hypothetical protein
MGDTKNKKNKKTATATDGATSKKAKKSAGESKKLAKAKGAGSIIAKARSLAFRDEAPPKAFAHFRPAAEKVPTENLAVFTGQPLLLRVNILAALAAIEPHLDAAVSALRDPRLDEVFELPSLIMALEFAVGRVPVAKLSAGEIDGMLAEGAPWRELMLTFLEIAAHPLINLLPRERVAAVRAGKGKLDQAQDFVAIPGLLAEFSAALEGKHPFPMDKIDLLATLGGTLVKYVRPGNAIAEVAKRSKESILRDQLASMVVERYDQLQVLAAVALGRRKADELLPALRATVGFSRPSDVSSPSDGTAPAPAGTEPAAANGAATAGTAAAAAPNA